MLSSFADEVQQLDCEVIISTARKAACLLDTMRLAGIWTPGAPHVSDRSLEFGLDWLEGRTVAIVDDVIGTGKTLDSLLLRCRRAGALVTDVRYVASKEAWASTLPLLRERHPGVDFSSRPAIRNTMEVVDQIVDSISSVPRPYNIDWPLYSGWRGGIDEIDWLVNGEGWNVRRAQNYRESGNPRFLTLEASETLRAELAQAHNVPVDHLALCKIRVYLEEREPGMFGVNILGVSSFNLLNHDFLSGLAKRHSLGPLSEYATVRLAQYELSRSLVEHLVNGRGALAGLGGCSESRWQRQLCFGTEMELGDTVQLSFTESTTAAAQRPQVNPDDSRHIRNVVIGVMQQESLKSKYRKARAEARSSIEAHRAFLVKTPPRESFTFSQLVDLIRGRYQGISDEMTRAEISSLLDDAIDCGATVPGWLSNSQGLERTFRAGETIRFSQREQGLLMELLSGLVYQDNKADLAKPTNKVGKTFVEKSLVLGVRYAAERTGFVELLDRPANGVPTLTVSFSRHGSILDDRPQAVTRPIADENTRTVANILAHRGLVKWRGPKGKRYAILTPFADLPQDENTPAFRSLGLTLATVFERQLVTLREFEALATLCNQKQYPLALLAEMSRFSGFLTGLDDAIARNTLSAGFVRSVLSDENDVGASIAAAFRKISAIHDRTARAVAARVAGALTLHDKNNWVDLTSRIFHAETPQSRALTDQCVWWLVRFASLLDEIRVEMRAQSGVLPTSNEIGAAADWFQMDERLFEFREKLGKRGTGTHRFTGAVEILRDDLSLHEAEIDLLFDTRCDDVSARRHYAVLAVRADKYADALCLSMQQLRCWRSLIPITPELPERSVNLFAILDGNADLVSMEVAALFDEPGRHGAAIIFRHLTELERVLHLPASKKWILGGSRPSIRAAVQMIDDQSGLFESTSGRSGPNVKAVVQGVKDSPGAVERADRLDVVLVCAAVQEWEVLQRETFGGAASKPFGPSKRHVLVGDLDVLGRTIRAAAVCPSDQGGEEMLVMVNDAVAQFSPRVVALVGIAGGLHKDLQIGDVVVANEVLRYSRGKVTALGFERDLVTSALPSDHLNHLVGLVGNLRNSLGWDVSVTVGAYAAGEVVVADELSEISVWLKSTKRRLMAIEMETGGFFSGLLKSSAAISSEVFWFAAKGISDHASGPSMGSPAEGQTQREWEDERARKQAEAVRASIRTSLALASLYLDGQ
jgi:nucleoside phosphorylase